MGVDNELYNRHREYFLSFLRNTTQKQRAIEHVLKKLSLDAKYMDDAIEKGDLLQLLDIGTGVGDFFLPFIGNAFPKVRKEYSLHEPNISVLISFLINYLGQHPFAALSAYSRDPKADFTCQEPEHYDLITASHVFYYIPNWSESLRALYSSLVPGGIAFLTLTSKRGFLYGFRERFFPQVDMPKPRSGEELCTVLDEINVPYEHEVIDSETDITDFFSRCDEGNDIVSFFLRTDYRKLPSSLQQEISDYLEQSSVHEQGRRILHFRDSAIWIQKPGVYQPREDTIVFSDMDYDEANLGQLKNLLMFAAEQSIGQDLKGCPQEFLEAYVTIQILNAFLSDPYYGDFIYEYHNDPRFMPSNKYSYEHQNCILGPLKPDEILVIDAGHRVRPEEYEGVKSSSKLIEREPDALHYLDNVIDCAAFHYQIDDLRKKIAETERSFEHSSIFTTTDYSVLAKWASDLPEPREKPFLEWRPIREWYSYAIQAHMQYPKGYQSSP